MLHITERWEKKKNQTWVTFQVEDWKKSWVFAVFHTQKNVTRQTLTANQLPTDKLNFRLLWVNWCLVTVHFIDHQIGLKIDKMILFLKWDQGGGSCPSAKVNHRSFWSCYAGWTNVIAPLGKKCVLNQTECRWILQWVTLYNIDYITS